MPSEIKLPSSSPRLHGTTTRHVLLYMISGNPGCIDYYSDFLVNLRALVDPLEGQLAFHIYGKDLAGFNDQHQPFSSQNPPFVVEDQIRLIIANLESQNVKHSGRPYDSVILMGHSVGAFISLEIFHRLMRDPSLAPNVRLTNGILLFPTVTHIAHSPAGRRLDFLRRRPWLFNIIIACVLAFLRLWPRSGLCWVVRTLMGFSPKAAGVTADFLKSRDAVWQALHMGGDEMAVISEDKWEKELWEIPQDASAHSIDVPKFYFFFGQSDHWVSDKFRHDFIESRKGHENGKTRILIDNSDLRHAFCTRESQSVVVAVKVTGWLKEMANAATQPQPSVSDSI